MRLRVIRLHFLIIFLMFVTTSMAQVPKWAITNKHDKYPPKKYFIGVGIAEDKSQAIERARADIGAQIRVRIESELVTMESEFHESDRVYMTSEVKSETKSIVSETIAGIEVAEVKKAKGKYYVLAVLSKSKYLSGLEVEMSEILAETEQLVESARTLSKEGKIFNAAENFIDAQSIIPEFCTKSALYTALSGKKYPVFEQLTGPGILAEMRETLSRIHLKYVSGNKQSGSSGAYLSELLMVKVTAVTESGEEIGVGKFPLIAKYENGDLIAKKETGDDGLAVFKVLAVPTDNVGSNGTVIIRLNLIRLPEVFKRSLTSSEVYFHYAVKTEALSFTIHVLDKNGIENYNVEKKIAALVTENGYSVSEDAQFILKGMVSVSNEKVLDIPSGKQYYIESSLKLQLVDSSNDNIVSSFQAKGKGLDVGSSTNAIEKAQKNLKFSRKRFASFLQKATQK